MSAVSSFAVARAITPAIGLVVIAVGGQRGARAPTELARVGGVRPGARRSAGCGPGDARRHRDAQPARGPSRAPRRPGAGCERQSRALLSGHEPAGGGGVCGQAGVVARGGAGERRERGLHAQRRPGRDRSGRAPGRHQGAACRRYVRSEGGRATRRSSFSINRPLPPAFYAPRSARPWGRVCAWSTSPSSA